MLHVGSMWRQIGAVVAGIVLSVAVLFTLYVLRQALLMIYVAVLLAILFDPAVRLVRRVRVHAWRPGRGVATAVVSFATAAILILLTMLILPTILADASRLEDRWPEQSARLFDSLHHAIPFTGSLTPTTVASRLHSLFGGSPVIAIGISLMDVLVTLLIAVYMLAQGQQAFEWGLTFVPEHHRSAVRLALVAGARRTQRWVGGQAILMLTHGGSALVVFWAIGLPFVTTLAVFAAIVNIIPVLGPVLTLVAAGVVALTTNPDKLLGVVIFYLVYHNVEGLFLQPRIMENAVGIPGVAVVTALLIGDEVAGFIGMAVSVPTAVLIAELKKLYGVRREYPKAAGHRS